MDDAPATHITVRQCANLFEVHYNTVIAWINDRKLEVEREGPRVRIQQAAIEKFRQTYAEPQKRRRYMGPAENGPAPEQQAAPLSGDFQGDLTRLSAIVDRLEQIEKARLKHLVYDMTASRSWWKRFFLRLAKSQEGL